MADRVSSAEEYFSIQLEKAQEDTKDARRKLHEEAVVARKSSEGVTAGFDMITSGSIAVGTIAGMVSPGTAVFHRLFGYFSS